MRKPIYAFLVTLGLVGITVPADAIEYQWPDRTNELGFNLGLTPPPLFGPIAGATLGYRLTNWLSVRGGLGLAYFRSIGEQGYVITINDVPLDVYGLNYLANASVELNFPGFDTVYIGAGPAFSHTNVFSPQYPTPGTSSSRTSYLAGYVGAKLPVLLGNRPLMVELHNFHNETFHLVARTSLLLSDKPSQGRQ